MSKGLERDYDQVMSANVSVSISINESYRDTDLELFWAALLLFLGIIWSP